MVVTAHARMPSYNLGVKEATHFILARLYWERVYFTSAAIRKALHSNPTHNQLLSVQPEKFQSFAELSGQRPKSLPVVAYQYVSIGHRRFIFLPRGPHR